MKCPFCEKEDKKSELESHGSSTTALGGYRTYYDEDGNYHHHDPNTILTTYTCSQGHKFGVRKARRCPNPDCDFGNEDPLIINYDRASDS